MNRNELAQLVAATMREATKAGMTYENYMRLLAPRQIADEDLHRVYEAVEKRT